MSSYIIVDVYSSREIIHWYSSTAPPNPLAKTQVDVSNVDILIFPFLHPHPPLLQNIYGKILVVLLICKKFVFPII